MNNTLEIYNRNLGNLSLKKYKVYILYFYNLLAINSVIIFKKSFKKYFIYKKT